MHHVLATTTKHLSINRADTDTRTDSVTQVEWMTRTQNRRILIARARSFLEAARQRCFLSRINWLINQRHAVLREIELAFCTELMLVKREMREVCKMDLETNALGECMIDAFLSFRYSVGETRLLDTKPCVTLLCESRRTFASISTLFLHVLDRSLTLFPLEGSMMLVDLL